MFIAPLCLPKIIANTTGFNNGVSSGWFRSDSTCYGGLHFVQLRVGHYGNWRKLTPFFRICSDRDCQGVNDSVYRPAPIM